jgi:MFS family permease
VNDLYYQFNFNLILFIPSLLFRRSTMEQVVLVKKRKFPRIFPGWWMVLTGGFLCLGGHGYYSYGISALFKPISSELGFSRAVTSVPTAIGRLEGGIEAPLSGWLTDKFGPKWVIFFGVFLISLSLILMNYINSTWSFYVVWGVLLAMGVNIALSVPLNTVLANWFVKKRGLAMGVQWMFSALSGTAVVPIIAFLIVAFGWRLACVFGGAAIGIIGLTATWFAFRRHRPEYYGYMPDGAATGEGAAEARQMIDRGVQYAREIEEVEFTLRQAMRTRGYWLMVISNAFYGLIIAAVNVHTIPFLTDIGISQVQAASMMALMIGSGIPARLAGGLVGDRIKTRYLPYVTGVGYLLMCAGFVSYLAFSTRPMIYVWFVLYGLGQGIAIVLFPLMVARYFGRKAFGSIHGSRQLLMAPFSMIAPIYAGWVFDSTGSYMSVFTIFTVFLAIAGVIMLFALPPKPPAKITAVDKIV